MTGHAALGVALALLLPATASAVTIDLTLDCAFAGGADCDPSAITETGTVAFTVGVQDSTGGLVDVNGYTLSFEFDPAVLTFVSSEQQAAFGGVVSDFLPLGDCKAENPATGLGGARCTAGNVPTEDAEGVGALFTLGFEVTALRVSPEALTVGILDPAFDDVTQGTGEPVFDEGDVVQVAFVPEPASALLLAAGLVGLGRRQRRRTHTSKVRTPSTSSRFDSSGR